MRSAIEPIWKESPYLRIDPLTHQLPLNDLSQYHPLPQAQQSTPPHQKPEAQNGERRNKAQREEIKILTDISSHMSDNEETIAGPSVVDKRKPKDQNGHV